MMTATVLTLLAAGSGSTALVEAALNGPSTTGGAGTRIEVLEVRAARTGDCAPSSLEPLTAPVRSGVMSVTLSGHDSALHRCTVSAVARVRVFSRVLVTSRAVKAGESLEGAVTALEREQLDGSPRVTADALPQGAVAARALAANTPLTTGHLREVGPQNGELIRVVVNLLGVRLVQEGHAARCASTGAICARLPNGRRVEGIWLNGQLEVAP